MKKSIKGKLCVLLLFLMAVLLLSGCGTKRNQEITTISFNRGHDSMWGNQFYIKINPEEIVTARYIPEDSWDLVTVEHLPITDTQWQTVKSMVEQLPFENARTNIWEKQKLDGSEYRELTVVRGKKEITYYWPNAPEAQQLEQSMEMLLKDPDVLLILESQLDNDTDDIDGGVKHSVTIDAPKTITSTQIISFHCEFSAAHLQLDGSPIARWYYTLHAAQDGANYEARGDGTVYNEREFIPDKAFFDDLQQIAAKYDFAQYNGQYYTVSGLPPDHGAKLEILYDSEESIRCSNNQSCFLPLEAMEELVSLFYPNNSAHQE